MKNLNLVLFAILFSVVSISLLANEEQKPNILIEQPELPREPELIGIFCTPYPRCIKSEKGFQQPILLQSVQTEPAPATE